MFIQLSEEKVNFYRENGFVQINNVLTESELDELGLYLDEVMSIEEGTASKSNSAYARVLNQKVNTWKSHAGMCKFAFHSRFADMARQLTGVNGIRFYHDHALWKNAKDSKETPWHQDFPKWPMNESGALSIWIALEDVNENNGCMKFIPKSHKLNNIKNIRLTESEDIFEYAKGTGITKEQEVCVPLKAGSCTFHDGLTFHYAHHNMADKPRKAYSIIYYPEGTTYNGKQVNVVPCSGLTKGQPFVTVMNPRLA